MASAATITLSAAPAAMATAPTQEDVSTTAATQKSVSSIRSDVKHNASTFAFRLAKGDHLAGNNTTIQGPDGTAELPTTAVDKNGEKVRVVYSEQDGVVTLQTVQKQSADVAGITTSLKLSKGARCALGTGGGAGSGAIAGGAAGATIGSAFPGVGTVAGWAIGTAIGGAVSGGAVGAAASC
ncbi:hypothetical protein PACID_03210 [Acidipropionibacterium acidipropionici ATCC 4875]|uniref:Uncharacterized protein n=1 Tax=Acidipropionibacterium acidipropionici (strain ATCC 4875 / DSM 20272 / JCM 6432 / NBRC 12425 / NCIMB 8070 / 4) TaxID=1171373 RepID=K7SFW0_ACIA4|nr:hypothetical protein PACID_03210 [Acidipropionibacterium acidipropionici ATCC 4875]